MINGNKNFSITVETNKAGVIKTYFSKETDKIKEDKFGKIEIFKFNTKKEALQYMEDLLEINNDNNEGF